MCTEQIQEHCDPRVNVGRFVSTIRLTILTSVMEIPLMQIAEDPVTEVGKMCGDLFEDDYAFIVLDYILKVSFILAMLFFGARIFSKRDE